MAFWGLLVILAFAGVWFINDSMEKIPEGILLLLGLSGGTGLAAYAISESKRYRPGHALDQLRIARDEWEAKSPASPDSATRLNDLKLQISDLERAAQLNSASFFQDICNDGNGLSFHRLQVVLWTLVLGAVFVRSVMQTMSMPEFPGSLLVLMGVSNVTYLGFKIPEKS